jgi:hypothetical protein
VLRQESDQRHASHDLFPEAGAQHLRAEGESCGASTVSRNEGETGDLLALGTFGEKICRCYSDKTYCDLCGLRPFPRSTPNLQFGLDYDQLLAKKPSKKEAVFAWHSDMAYWFARRKKTAHLGRS